MRKLFHTSIDIVETLFNKFHKKQTPFLIEVSYTDFL